MASKLKHALIAPTSYLHTIPEDFSDFHLILAHLLDDPEYAHYYRTQHEKGAFIIMDNGAFEFKRPLETPELLKYIKKAGFQPNIIVAPDYPYENWKTTYNAAAHFSRVFTDSFDIDQTKIMAVPQSEKGDWKGWLRCYDYLGNIEHVDFIGMSILGIPNAWCSYTKTNDISFNRIVCTETLIQHDLHHKHIKHHYLGCGDPRELLMMQQQGLAYSNDSSTAYWHAINGIVFDDSAGGLVNGKTSKEVDFDIDFDKTKKHLIQHNIDWIRTLLSREERAM